MFAGKVCVLFALVAASNAVTFNCMFSQSSNMILGMIYGCNAQVDMTDGNSLTLLNVTGSHSMEWQKNSLVGSLTMTDIFQVLNKIPEKIGDFFPGIIQIQWQMGNLTSLTSDDLKQFRFLRSLSLRGQKITTLDGNLFQNNLEMIEINFGSNQIIKVGDNLITNLKNLTSVDFMGNRCVSFTARTSSDMPILSLHLAALCK